MQPKSQNQKPVFVSQTPFVNGTADTLAVFCSDGRFVQQTADYLRSLGISLVDWEVWPGGGHLIFGPENLKEACKVLSAFLKDHHGIKNIILIAHLADCGWFKHTHAEIGQAEERDSAQVDCLKELRQAWQTAFPDVRLAILIARPNSENLVEFLAIE
ncbi:MAG: hypothetical protein ACD_11C00070G0002 [uncultured bacterium]|nr:MAG: hypothetical protein ACD_11C00070G0002 [uncultured bacterium]